MGSDLMGRTYVLKFSLDIFPKAWRPDISEFLEGNLSSEDLRRLLGFNQEALDSWFSTLFLMGIDDDEPEAELRRV